MTPRAGWTFSVCAVVIDAAMAILNRRDQGVFHC
jgi:hypothetical protein